MSRANQNLGALPRRRNANERARPVLFAGAARFLTSVLGDPPRRYSYDESDENIPTAHEPTLARASSSSIRSTMSGSSPTVVTTCVGVGSPSPERLPRRIHPHRRAKLRVDAALRVEDESVWGRSAREGEYAHGPTTRLRGGAR